MMESILVLSLHERSGEQLSKGSLEALTAGNDLAPALDAVLTVGIVAAMLKAGQVPVPTASRVLVVAAKRLPAALCDGLRGM